jgi:hypothetical protein
MSVRHRGQESKIVVIGIAFPLGSTISTGRADAL